MKLYLIRAAAERAGLSTETVRNYCRQGLLTPIRDSAGRRLFTPENIQEIRQIYDSGAVRRPGKELLEPERCRGVRINEAGVGREERPGDGRS